MSLMLYLTGITYGQIKFTDLGASSICAAFLIHFTNIFTYLLFVYLFICLLKVYQRKTSYPN